MNRALWKVLIATMWLALPAIALSYWLAWDRLPSRLATHFDAAGRANGWMPPATSLIFGLVVTAVMLVIFTIILTLGRKSETFSLAMLGFSFVLVGVMMYANESILNYNLHGNPIRPWPVLIAVVLASVALVAGTLGMKRGQDLPSRPVLAEEVHASPVWGLILGIPAAIELAITVLSRNVGLRTGMGMGAAVLFLAAVLAWSGFQVWSNAGVRIKTRTGQVFLGHRDPARIIHDLDVLKQFAH